MSDRSEKLNKLDKPDALLRATTIGIMKRSKQTTKFIVVDSDSDLERERTKLPSIGFDTSAKEENDSFFKTDKKQNV